MRKLALSLALIGMTLIASAQDIQLPKPQLENKVNTDGSLAKPPFIPRILRETNH